MNDHVILFREAVKMLQTEGGRGKFCAALVRRGEKFIDTPFALRLLILEAMPYRSYLQTEYWKELAKEAKERAGNRCQLCNSKEQIEAHHRTYERRGHEEDGDLTVLCSDYHRKFHDKMTADSDEPPACDPGDIAYAMLTPEEQTECLSAMISAKRRRQGIKTEEAQPVSEAVQKVLSMMLNQNKRS